MGQTFSIGQARAQAVLAFARGCEVNGIDYPERDALISEYAKHRDAVMSNPADRYDFETKVEQNLSGEARAALDGYLIQAGWGGGQPSSFVNEGRARAQAVLGFARGCEINGIDWGNERDALKAEYFKHRDALQGADLAEFNQVLRDNASGEARDAIFSWLS